MGVLQPRRFLVSLFPSRNSARSPLLVVIVLKSLILILHVVVVVI